MAPPAANVIFARTTRTTKSDFAPRLLDAKGLAAAVPNRLEHIDGGQVQQWLKHLTSSST
jgi:hypothetical protein